MGFRGKKSVNENYVKFGAFSSGILVKGNVVSD